MSDMVNVGLIGFGVGGRVFHAPLIAATKGLNLAKIVQRHGDEARLAYPKSTVVRSADDVLADPAIDLVVIATPNTSHFDLARAALTAGKHVVVDKPFTVTSEDAQRLIELARARRRVLSVFHNRRWDADFLTIQQLMKKGLLGRIVTYEAHFDRFRPQIKNAWREEDAPGSGILYDLGSHLIDQALALFGRPQSVCADLQRQRDGARVDDYFQVALGYAGLTATLRAGMLVREPGPQFTVHGTRGSFLKDGRDPQEDALRNGVPLSSPDWGREPSDRWGRLNTDIDGVHFSGQAVSLPGRYQTYYENIRAAIGEGAELIVKPDEARDVIRVIELAIESHAKGSTLVADFTRERAKRWDAP